VTVDVLPPVRLVPGFIADPGPLFDWVVQQTPWDHRIKARLTASFGRPYNYAGLDYPEAAMPEPLVHVCRRLEPEVGFQPDNCLLNFYPDGHSKMGYHADDVSELVPGTGVAIVSLGGARPMKFRGMGDPNRRHEIVLEAGSLLYMPPEVHQAWVHGILRCAHAEPRISLTFRRLRGPCE
jgi:hypothetical protein